MKHSRIFLPLITVCLLMSGCSSAPDINDLNFSSSTSKIYELESSSYLVDLDLFYDLQEQSATQQQDAQQDEKVLILLNYIDQVYSLACARVEADLGDLGGHSQEYKDYLLLLEAYCELYFEYREDLPEAIDKGTLDDDPLIQSLKNVETYYAQIAEETKK